MKAVPLMFADPIFDPIFPLFCFSQSLGAEKDSLDIVQHEWALPKLEQRAEAVLRKLVG